MANLETLELTINANAESASQGLNTLINSLSALSQKVNEAFNAMSRLNGEIQRLRGNGNMSIRLPNVSSGGAVGRATRVASSTTRAANSSLPPGVFPVTQQLPPGSQILSPNGRWIPVNTSANVQAATNNAQAAQAAATNSANQPVTNANVQTVTNYAQATQQAANNTNKLGNEMEKTKTKAGGLSKGISRIGRIFSTMLIRTAIRSLIKAFQNAWSAAYNFSKNMGGQFAESVDKAKTLLAGAATSIISTFSPAISALIPVIQSVVGAIQYLCKAIQWLFSLLGMGNELFGASTDAINAYSGASGGASKANKEMLASFDELNVISQETGGGGGGGGGGASYKNGLFSDIVSDEMAKIQLIVSESLLALGLILACTGHFGLGIGLMAIGAAGIAKTVIADWGALSKEMQGELATIMTIVGAATLALGAILAFSGANIPLGIGLMAIGAANLAAVAYVNFTNGLPDEVKKTITTILGIVGGALLAVGAVLAFSGANIPLGIGLMIAGGLSLAGAVALNWDSLSKKVKQVFEGLCWAIENAWENVKTAVNGAWDAVKKWWEDSGVGPGVRKIWGGVSSFFRGLWDDVSSWAQAAWSGVSQWWHTNVTSKIEKGGIWGGVAGFFSGLWEGISTAAQGAWDVVKDWWETSGVGQWVRGTWSEVGNFLTNSIWNPIKNTAKSAWNTVKDWWEKTGIGQWVRGAWSDVGNFMTNSIWNPIKNTAVNAWNEVKKWWETSGIGTWVSRAWSDVGNFLTNSIWNPIKNAATSAWDTVKQWWENTGIGDAIDKVWSSVKKVFEDVFSPIEKALEWIRELFGYNDKSINVNVAVSETASSSRVVQNVVATAASQTQKSTPWYEQLWNGAKNLLGIRAEGGYDIPRGELFIAQEAGAELIGSINGKTSVANQQQIIEGIASGVERANSEQNTLLREQNNLLRGILEKDASVRIGASAALGRVAKQSIDMYGSMIGG